LKLTDEFCNVVKVSYRQNTADTQYIVNLADKSRYTSFLHGVFGKPSCCLVSD